MEEQSSRRAVADPRRAEWQRSGAVFVAAFGVVALGLYCLAVWLDWLPWLRGWKFYPRGWTSVTFPYPEPSRLVPLVALALAVWVAVLLAERARDALPVARRLTVVVFLAALVALGYLLQLGFLGVKSENALAFMVHRVTDRVLTGYFTLAVEAKGLSTYFADYPRVYDTKLCPHCHDHPPGPALFYWLNLKAASALPEGAQHALAGEARQAMGDGPVATRLKSTYTDAQLLGAILAGSMVLLLAALVVVPLYGLARLLGPPGQELRLAALGLALPGLLLMSPQTDQIYATLTAAALYAGLRGLHAPGRTHSLRVGFAWALAAGALVALGVYFSWALGIVLAVLGALGVVGLLSGRGGADGGSALFRPGEAGGAIRVRELGAWAAGLALGAAVPLVVLLLAGVDLPYILQYNLSNAARAEGQRPYLVWLFYGPLEFVQFLGLPLAVVALASLRGRPLPEGGKRAGLEGGLGEQAGVAGAGAEIVGVEGVVAERAVVARAGTPAAVAEGIGAEAEAVVGAGAKDVRAEGARTEGVTEERRAGRMAQLLSWVNPYAGLFWLVVLLIDVMGRSKAEQGRLLIFLMPLALVGVYHWAGRRGAGRGWITALYVAQMLVTLVIGARWFVPV